MAGTSWFSSMARPTEMTAEYATTIALTSIETASALGTPLCVAWSLQSINDARARRSSMTRSDENVIIDVEIDMLM
jgi:hypothetical protein